jgi:hypothetical protein
VVLQVEEAEDLRVGAFQVGDFQLVALQEEDLQDQVP